MTSLKQRCRLSVNLTVLMRLAIDDLAERNGLGPSTQATILLRQALDRTMQSKPVQDRYKQHLAQRTVREWRDETPQEHAIETTYSGWSSATGTAREQ